MAYFYKVGNMQDIEGSNEEGGILIEYQVYNHFWQTCFAKNEDDEQRIVAGLKKLSHVTAIKQPEPSGTNAEPGGLSRQRSRRWR